MMSALKFLLKALYIECVKRLCMKNYIAVMVEIKVFGYQHHPQQCIHGR